MKVRWTARAESDLSVVFHDIAADNLGAAVRLQDRLVEAAEGLVDFPLRGRTGRLASTRELAISGTRYLAVYSLDADTVWILHLLDGAQDWPPTKGS